MIQALTRRLAVAALSLLIPAAAVGADQAPALVDAAWLKANLDAPDLVVLDLQDPKAFQQFHIPGAVNGPYALWRTRGSKTKLGSMLPPVAQLEARIGGLGISNDSHVVITATGRGAGDLAAAARVFWTFKVLGHDRVSVLDGGLVGYDAAGGRLAKGASSPQPADFSAEPRADWAPDADAVREALAAGALPVDARSEGEFVGIYTGDEKERPGTIPGSKHLPHDWVTDAGSARLRSEGALKSLFEARGIDPEAEQVHFCHSGNRAALTWFAAYAVFGNEDARLYDGSMMEWARRDDLPVAAEIELCEAC